MGGGKAQSIEIAEIAFASVQARVDHRAIALMGLNRQLDFIIWRSRLKMIRHIQVHERRNVELLAARLMDQAIGTLGEWNDIRMATAERIVDLVDHGDQSVVGSGTEIHTQRIEVVSGNARHTQKSDGYVRSINPGRLQAFECVLPEWLSRAVSVVAILETNQVRSVVREQPQPVIDNWQLFEIEQQPVNPVAQRIALWIRAVMADMTDVECGTKRQAATPSPRSTIAGADVTMRPDSLATRQGRLLPDNCSPTANPACRPSS